ncbi:hypothetical protein T3H00_01865 [Pseudomonas fluorescens]|uniref:hypothetical protein n=1 Tax=Pseudomonas fluorescens TaxID=294 RepID=UPI002ACA9CE0|nr:hypothetical protein [Pseudomonas fluorescens]MDZ5431413.1 hypothetical protein [Pseudomonas fluorescens]
MASLKSKLRGRLMASHGARRNTKNNLWLAYSLKSSADITLASNNECIYWACRLESDPSIKSFRFGCELEAKYPWEERFQKREFIVVDTALGGYELHQLVSGNISETRAEVEVREGLTALEHIPVTLFNIKDIGLLAMLATRWLQVMAFSNQIRNEKCVAEASQVGLLLRSLLQGTVGGLLERTQHCEPMKVMGVIAQEALLGTISLDLEGQCFGRNTYWSVR